MIRELLDELDRAHEDAEVALREDCPIAQRLALERIRDARQKLGNLGGLLIVLALDHADILVQKKLDRVFGGLAHSAHDQALRAAARATHAIKELDSLKIRVKELETALSMTTLSDERPAT